MLSKFSGVFENLRSTFIFNFELSHGFTEHGDVKGALSEMVGRDHADPAVAFLARVTTPIVVSHEYLKESVFL